MLKTNYILSLSLLISIPLCAMERPPHLNNAKPAAAPKLVLKAAAKPAPAVANTKSTCAVCFDDKTALDTRTLACGHKFCLECLRGNIQTAINDKQAQALKCFDPKCKRPIDIADLRKIIYDKNTQNQINNVQFDKWLASQENIKHCPTTNCHFSFVNERADQFTHKCPDCKKEYCGKCLHNHEPATSCQQAEKDRAVANDRNAHERANREWELAHTKSCPRCRTKTEKSAGCNRMTCSRCEHSYCWNCLGPWDMVTYSCKNKCGAQVEDEGQQAVQPGQITWENMHTHFARDPRGFIKTARDRQDLYYFLQGVNLEFAERFMKLSCEDQGIWVARINNLVARDKWAYQYNIARTWTAELARFEPFAFRINNYYGNMEGSFTADISFNREWNTLSDQLSDQIKQWIANQNPQDFIMFHRWTCETMLSRERLQQVLDQASRHFKNQIR